jgi:IS5 family transposase
VDKAHKLIRKWGATVAAVHDSQKLDAVLDLSNAGKEVWADSAYRSVPESGTSGTSPQRGLAAL